MYLEQDKTIGKMLLVAYIGVCAFLGYLLIDNPFDTERNENCLKQEYNLISKYKYVINRKEPDFQRTPELENKIWMLWLQGEENAPDIVKRVSLY